MLTQGLFCPLRTCWLATRSSGPVCTNEGTSTDHLADVIAKRLGVASDDLRANVIVATIVASIRTALQVWGSRPGAGDRHPRCGGP